MLRESQREWAAREALLKRAEIMKAAREALRGEGERLLDLICEARGPNEISRWLAAPLESATARGDENLSKKLIQAGAKIGESSLHGAVRGGHTAIVDLLLESGASVDGEADDYGMPLHVAAEGGHMEIARLLLRRGAALNAEDGCSTTPLTRAIAKGHLAMAELLLNAGADLTKRITEFELSALDIACHTDGGDAIRLLIKHGADVNLAASNGSAALHIAADAGKVGAIQVLVGAGADLEGGRTRPLHYAAGAGYLDGGVWPEAVLALLNLGAEINAPTSRGGETALHCAAAKARQRGSVEVVDLLLRRGADETIVSSQGATALKSVGTRRIRRRLGLPGGNERVRTLLARAPADRAWRRRGLLVLCRAHPERLRLEGDLASLVAKVFGLVEAGVFRKIVLYL